MDVETAQALIRFGLGRRGAAPLPADPRAWLRAQLAAPEATGFGDLPSTADGLAAIRADRENRRKLKDDPSAPRSTRVRDLYLAEATAQIAYAIETDTPFRERLVWFWSNHFTVSIHQFRTAAIVGAYVREAIRPHVMGRFADMLLAVMRHPAMLMYLDNIRSAGPDSPAGRRRGRGLNENLARECLELHTLGAEGGYTQADVTGFAAILTGWSVQLNDQPGFLFRAEAHQPGAKTLLGRTFPEGEAGGVQALAFLAAHPSTHRHLAKRLAAEFVADDPPEAAVRRLEAVLRDSGGDLGTVSAALIDFPEAWAVPLGRLRPPQLFAVAALRTLDLPPERRPNLPGSLDRLGQRLWSAPLPNGWPGAAEAWAAPEALLRRADWSYGLAGRAGSVDAEAVAEAALGPFLRDATRDAIRHAGSRRDALTLALAAPEFQRC